MKINREHFKSKKFIFLFSIVLTSITLAISEIFPFLGNIHLIILPILSLILGPFAIIGFGIVEFIYLMVTHPHHVILNILAILILSISNFAIWKLWYSIMNKYGLETPNLISLYDLIKVSFLFFTYTLIVLILLFPVHEGLAVYDIEVDYFSTIFSYFAMIFLLYIVNYFKIPVYSPQKQFKQFIPKRAYLIFLVLFILMGVGQLFFLFHDSIIVGLIIPILLIVYLLKPYDKDISKIKKNVGVNLFSKVNLSLVLILLSMSLIIEIFANIAGLRYGNSLFDIQEDLLALIIEMLIPILIYLYFLERNVTKPMNILSGIMSEDIDTNEDYLNHDQKLKNIKVNNEIKILIDSLRDMEHDMIEYGRNLVKVTSEKEKYETELKLASDIQNSMIPKDFKEFNDNFTENKDNFELFGVMKAAHEMGGDFYDYFKIDGDNIGFVIGDVSDKGMSAALIMVKAMTLIQDYIKQYKELSQAVYYANNNLCEDNVENFFVTCWIGKINLKTKELSFINAGHNHPLIKLNGNDFEYIDIKPGLVLAAMEEMPYEIHTIQLTKGDAIFLYTDGVTDANDNYNEFYGKERLKNILNKHKNDDLSDIINSVENDIDEFCNQEEQFDDTTMFVIRLK